MSYSKEGFLAKGDIVPTIYNCPQPRIVGRTVVQPESSKIYAPEVSLHNYLQSREVRLDYLDRDTAVEVLGVSGKFKYLRVGFMIEDVDFLEPVPLDRGKDTPGLWRIRWPVVDLYSNKRLVDVISADTRPGDFEVAVKMVMIRGGVPTSSNREVKQWVGSTLSTRFFGPYPRTFRTADFAQIAGLSVGLGGRVINVIEKNGVVEVSNVGLFYISKPTIEMLDSIHSRFDPDYFDVGLYL